MDAGTSSTDSGMMDIEWKRISRTRSPPSTVPTIAARETVNKSGTDSVRRKGDLRI